MKSELSLGNPERWPDHFKAFHTWWWELGNKGQLAPKSGMYEDMLPDALKAYSFLIERHRGGDFIVHIAGDALNAVSAKRLEGENYLARFPADQAAVLGECMTHVCGQPCGADIVRTVEQLDGRQVSFRHLVLPMVDMLGIVSYVAGIVDLLAISDPKNEPRVQPSNQLDGVAYLDIGNGLPVGLVTA